MIAPMDPNTYRLLHVVGVLVVFLGLGGMLAAEPGKAPKLFGMLHGVGLLVMLVAGIGFAHKSGLGWPHWMIAKIGCWLLVGAVPTLVKRGMLTRLLGLLLALGLGGVAVWLAQAKPF
jgi:hypothetical protein